MAIYAMPCVECFSMSWTGFSCTVTNNKLISITVMSCDTKASVLTLTLNSMLQYFIIELTCGSLQYSMKCHTYISRCMHAHTYPAHTHTYTHLPFDELLTLSLDIACSSIKVGEVIMVLVSLLCLMVSTSRASSADWAVSGWRRERWWAWLDDEGSKSVG